MNEPLTEADVVILEALADAVGNTGIKRLCAAWREQQKQNTRLVNALGRCEGTITELWKEIERLRERIEDDWPR